jgi:hypothetical protein
MLLHFPDLCQSLPMPTTYKPDLDHRPIEQDKVSRGIDAFLDEHLLRLVSLGRNDEAVIEDDEIEPMRQEFSTRLLMFEAKCIARPIRAINKVIATLKRMAKDPDHFIVHVETYDPEATDALFVEFGRLSSDHKRISYEFWRGEGALDPEDVRRAALAAIARYPIWRSEQKGKEKKASGAPRNELLRKFADLAADLFRMVGGKPTATDEGPFRKFVELLREPVKGAARAASCALTPVSIIRHAAKTRASASSPRRTKA